MRKMSSSERIKAFSRRKFIHITAASLIVGTHFACTATNKSKYSEKVLIFGHVPQRYLKQWEITCDFGVVAQKLGIQLDVAPTEKVMGQYNDLSDAKRVKATTLAKQLIDEAQQGMHPRPNDVEIEEATRFFLAIRAMITEHKASAATIACRTHLFAHQQANRRGVR